ncbi:MAG: hypothetical protein KDA89_06295, partial [Planctomycetaceae bacterium]|nr:hypothetical protein [Planctomycetaceae bacterium]
MTIRYSLLTFVFLFFHAAVSNTAVIDAAELQLSRGSRIAILGNTLADRMQHFGWVESRLQTRFPQQELVIRNLGFSADTLTTRPRSDSFGTPDEWLTKVKADVVFAFFGYNEAFAGEAGVDQFRAELAAFIDHTLSQNYNGSTPPQLVLFSPIAHENLHNRLLPDGTANNARLQLYTKAMQATAEQKQVLFVDLFQPTLRMYEQDDVPATINGIHMNSHGYEKLSDLIDAALFGPGGRRTAEELRQAVLQKNLYWHNIYRATDGYSVFGGRSALKFVDGQTNYEVQQRELEILNVMTSNRDRVIWAAAQGRQVTADDSNLPEPIPVISNKPGTLEEGKHRFLGGEEAMQMMTVHHGMEINLFASEEQFPELVNPVQSAVDPDGRLWVAAWPTYPHWHPLEEMNDKLLILPDEDGDGRADRCITFADGLHNPTGFEFFNGGVLVAMAPDIFFLKDTDGDDRADIRERIFHGLDSADTHHTANSFVMGPDGRFFFSRGIFHYENFETPTRTYRANSGTCGVFKWDPLTWEIDHQFQIGPNPHGDSFDQWGRQFATDGTGGTGNYVGFPGRGAPKQLYEKRVRPVPATCILDSEHFPQENRGNFLIANVIGFQGVTQYAFEADGASLHAAEVEPIVYSTDPNFRPSDMEIGGDGSLLILDWQNPLIGHMQHNLRDPSRDHGHGRVYRVTTTGSDPMTPKKMRGRPIAEVVRNLASPTLSERYRARLELTGRDSREVTQAAAAWAATFDAADAANGRHLTEALWIHQQHRLPNFELLSRILSSPEPNARAAAVPVLAEWVGMPESALTADEAIALLTDLADDPDARVRAQAVIAATHVPADSAPEVVFTARQHPTDIQLDFDLREAGQLLDVDGYIRRLLADGKDLSAAAEAYALSNAAVDELLKMKRTEAACEAILTRENAPSAALKESLSWLAKHRNTSEIEELFDLIEGLNDKASAGIQNSLARLLSEQSAEQLRSVRDRLASLAVSGHTAETRRVALASWMTADGRADAAFDAAAVKKIPLEEVLRAVSLVSGNSTRLSALDRLVTIIPNLPASQGSAALTEPGLDVDFYHPNPKDVALETLAKLQPKASGRATQITMEVPVLQKRDQFALRFRGSLKVELPGEYTFFLSSDDGSRMYLDGQLLINHDGLHGFNERRSRASLTPGLHELAVTYFDNGGGDGLQLQWTGPGINKQDVPAEALVTAAEQTPQELAIAAMMSLPGGSELKTDVLAGLLKKRQSSNTALAAIASIPAGSWPD